MNARSYPGWMDAAARYGLVAKGVMYGVLGLLAFQVALGQGSEEASQRGVVQTLSRQPLGFALLVVLAAGLAGYALWRFLQARYYRGDGNRVVEAGRRATFVVRGFVYLGLAVLAGQELAGSASSVNEQSVTGRILQWPFGVPLAVSVGAVLIAAGLYQGYKAASRDFIEDVTTAQMTSRQRRLVVVAGALGLVARLVVFGLTGGFLVRAALRFDPDTGVGLDAALEELSQAPYGRAAIAVVAGGLVVYALFCGVLARYGRVRTLG